MCLYQRALREKERKKGRESLCVVLYFTVCVRKTTETEQGRSKNDTHVALCSFSLPERMLVEEKG